MSGLQKYLSISLSPHTQTLANPLFSRVYEHSPPQKTSIHFTLSSGNGVESPPLLPLASPTLPYRELTLHLLYTFSLYKICKPLPLPKIGSVRPTSSRQNLGDTHCRNLSLLSLSFRRQTPVHFCLLCLLK